MKIEFTSIGAVRVRRSVAIHLGLNLTLAGCLCVASARAQSQNDVAVSLVARRVIVQDGQEKLVAADRALPGDVLEYAADYHNQSRHGVGQLAPSLPIPAGMMFVPGSAGPRPRRRVSMAKHSRRCR